MSLLKNLEKLLGGHQQQAKAPVPQRGAIQAEDGSYVNPNFYNHRGMQAHQSQGIPLQMHGQTEDSQMMPGQQGFVPMNADVGHFNVPGRGMQEDQYAAPSQQGYTPLNADIAHFNVPSGQVSRFPVNSGFTPLQNSGFGPRGNPQQNAYTAGLQTPRYNPQVRDNGYFYDQ